MKFSVHHVGVWFSVWIEFEKEMLNVCDNYKGTDTWVLFHGEMTGWLIRYKEPNRELEELVKNCPLPEVIVDWLIENGREGLSEKLQEIVANELSKS